MGAGGLEDVEGSDSVGPEGGGVVGLGWRGQHPAEMVDRAGTATRHGRIDLGRIPKVAANGADLTGQAAQPRGRRVEVEQRDARLAFGQQDARDLGAQEAGAARDQSCHRRRGASVHTSGSGLNLGRVTSSVTSSKVTATAMPMRIASGSGSTPTRLVGKRTPSSSSTIATT